MDFHICYHEFWTKDNYEFPENRSHHCVFHAAVAIMLACISDVVNQGRSCLVQDIDEGVEEGEEWKPWVT